MTSLVVSNLVRGSGWASSLRSDQSSVYPRISFAYQVQTNVFSYFMFAVSLSPAVISDDQAPLETFYNELL